MLPCGHRNIELIDTGLGLAYTCRLGHAFTVAELEPVMAEAGTTEQAQLMAGPDFKTEGDTRQRVGEPSHPVCEIDKSISASAMVVGDITVRPMRVVLES